MEDYEYLANLGEGAYGFVWKCVERATGRLVAIKGMKQAHEEPEIMRLAVREVRVLQTLKHPAIIPLIEAFKSKSGRVYMVFPYVGHSAYQELDEHPDGLPYRQLKLLVWQLLQALVYLHRRKVVHRDIKPGNILLSEGGGVKLCDFGFARTTHCGPRDAEDLTSYVVTRWYRAPEVLVGDRYGPACDIWSLGCTVAELATGQPLFPGKSTGEQLWRVMRCFGPLTAAQLVHMTCNPSLVRVRVPVRGRTLRERLLGCDPDLFRLVESCLQLDPSDRPTARELLQSPYFWDIPQLLAGTPLEQVYSGLMQQQEERRQRQQHPKQQQNQQNRQNQHYWKEEELRQMQQMQEPHQREQQQQPQPPPIPKQQQQQQKRKNLVQQQQESRKQGDMTGMGATGQGSSVPVPAAAVVPAVAAHTSSSTTAVRPHLATGSFTNPGARSGAATGSASGVPRASEETARDLERKARQLKQEEEGMPRNVLKLQQQQQQLEEEGENDEMLQGELSTTSSLIPMTPGDLGGRDVQQVAMSTNDAEDMAAEVDVAELAAEAIGGGSPQAQKLSKKQQWRMLQTESRSESLQGVLRALRTVDTLVPERFPSSGSLTEEQPEEDTVQPAAAVAADAITRDTAAAAAPIHHRSERPDGPPAGGAEGTIQPFGAAGDAGGALAASPPNPPTPPCPPPLQQHRRRGSDCRDAVNTAARAAGGAASGGLQPGARVITSGTTQAAALTTQQRSDACSGATISCMRTPYGVTPVALASYGDITLPSSTLSLAAAANAGSVPPPIDRQSSIVSAQYDMTAAPAARHGDDVAPYSAIRPRVGPPAPNPCRDIVDADADDLCNNLPGNTVVGAATAAAAAAVASSFRSSCGPPLVTSHCGDVTDFDLSTAISVYPYGCTEEDGMLLLHISENFGGGTTTANPSSVGFRSTSLLLAQPQAAGIEPSSLARGQASPSGLVSLSTEPHATAAMQRLLQPSRSARFLHPPPPPSQPPAVLMMSMDSSLRPLQLAQSLLAASGGSGLPRRLQSSHLGSASGSKGPYQDGTATAVAAAKRRSSIGGSYSCWGPPQPPAVTATEPSNKNLGRSMVTRGPTNVCMEMEDAGEAAKTHCTGPAAGAAAAAAAAGSSAGVSAAAKSSHGRVSSLRRAGTGNGRLLVADDPAVLPFSSDVQIQISSTAAASGGGGGGMLSRHSGMRTLKSGQSPKIAPAPTASMAWAATPPATAPAPALTVSASSPSAVPAGQHASRSRFMMMTTAPSLSQGWLSRDASGSPLPTTARIAKASSFADAPTTAAPLQVLMTLSPHATSASKLEGSVSAVAAIADGLTYGSCSNGGPEGSTATRRYAKRVSRTVSGHDVGASVDGSVNNADSAYGSFNQARKGGPLLRFLGAFKKAFSSAAATTAKQFR